MTETDEGDPADSLDGDPQEWRTTKAMRRSLFAIGIAAVVVAVGTGAAILSHAPRGPASPPLALPAVGEVVKMRASLREFEGSPEITDFEVPADQVAAVLSWLEPAKPPAEPWPLDPTLELGEIRIQTRAGADRRLRFYWAGKNPAVFTPNGRDVYHGRSKDRDGRWIDGGGSLRGLLEQISRKRHAETRPTSLRSTDLGLHQSPATGPY